MNVARSDTKMVSVAGPPGRAVRKGVDDPPLIKAILILISVSFLLTFVVLPLVNVFAQAWSKGLLVYWAALNSPESRSAIQLTLLVAVIVVPLNTVFGVAAAWAITKFHFPGKTLLVTAIDLPFSVSPVVTGMMFLLLFGLQGLLGPWLDERDIQVVFAVPALVLVTLFVTSPFVARELIPVMQASGSEQEQAALTLGASGWTTFWHVTLPSIKWALLYGVILCNARAMGEFGAVSVVSGHITGRTDTLPLRIEKLYNEYQGAAAFSVASLLAVLALLTLGLKTVLEWRINRNIKSLELPVPGTPGSQQPLSPGTPSSPPP